MFFNHGNNDGDDDDISKFHLKSSAIWSVISKWFQFIMCRVQNSTAICINALVHISILNMTFLQTMNPCLNFIHSNLTECRARPSAHIHTYIYTCVPVVCMRWHKILLKHCLRLALSWNEMQRVFSVSVINNIKNIQTEKKNKQSVQCSCKIHIQGKNDDKNIHLFSWLCCSISVTLCVCICAHKTYITQRFWSVCRFFWPNQIRM